LLEEFKGKPIRALVVWEPVLATDWGAPSTATLKRVADTRAIQFWDKARLVSHILGEHDEDSIVWDNVAVYRPGAAWKEAPPQALYSNTPVIEVIERVRSAISEGLAAAKP
jgi:hypothetical protein